MVRHALNDCTGYVTERSVDHYHKRSAGVGLVIIEAVAVAQNAKMHSHMLGLWCDKQIVGMHRLVDAIHSSGATVMIQLCYAGICSHDSSALALGPSAEYFDSFRIARAVTEADLAEIRELHVQAALRAQKAGFDGIEIHATHGYFYGRFLDTVSNQRTDRFAGSTAVGRALPLVETLNAIRAAIGDKMLLSARLGCNTPDFETARENLIEVAKAPINLIHLSRGTVMPEPDPDIPNDFPCNTVVFHGTKLARETSLPVILSNEIRTPEQAEYLISNGFCDFAAVGRGILADPRWALKASGADPDEIDGCFGCSYCQWPIDPERCPAAVRQAKREK